MEIVVAAIIIGVATIIAARISRASVAQDHRKDTTSPLPATSRRSWLRFVVVATIVFVGSLFLLIVLTEGSAVAPFIYALF